MFSIAIKQGALTNPCMHKAQLEPAGHVAHQTWLTVLAYQAGDCRDIKYFDQDVKYLTLDKV